MQHPPPAPRTPLPGGEHITAGPGHPASTCGTWPYPLPWRCYRAWSGFLPFIPVPQPTYFPTAPRMLVGLTGPLQAQVTAHMPQPVPQSTYPPTAPRTPVRVVARGKKCALAEAALAEATPIGGVRGPCDVFVKYGKLHVPLLRGHARGWVQFITAFAAEYSAGHFAAARTAVDAHEIYAEGRGARPWPATPVLVGEFLQVVRALHHAEHADTNRGCAAKSRLHALNTAANLIRALAARALVDMRVKAAAKAPEAATDRQEFN